MRDGSRVLAVGRRGKRGVERWRLSLGGGENYHDNARDHGVLPGRAWAALRILGPSGRAEASGSLLRRFALS